MLFKQHRKLIARVAQDQLGSILPLVILASLLGLAIVVPVAVLVGTAALQQGGFEDKTRDFYLTDSAVMAVISDLQRGADGHPVFPRDYIPPTVNFDDSVPNITVLSLEAFLASQNDPVTGAALASQTVSTTRMVTYQVDADPVLSAGAIVEGGVPELAEDDGTYFRVTAPNTNSTTFNFEVTSEAIGFSRVDFVEVKLKTRAWEESVRLEVFVFNPTGTGHDPTTGYNAVPDAANLLNHLHAWDHDLPHDHKHDDDHDREPHTHDALHFHGKDAKDHDHKGHHGLNPLDHHDDHEDARDLHHDHHDDNDHEEDEGHGHHGGHSHDHHHDKGKDTDHHHYEDALGNDDHLLVHNHADDHQHHGHKGKQAHHHGEETISFFLSQQDLTYLSLPATTALKLKVKATVFVDPAHHHHVKKHDDFDEEGKKIKGGAHDHIHHANRLDLPPFSIETDQVLFELGGPATTDLRLPAGEPVINVGTVVSGVGANMRLDDNSFFTVASEMLAQAIHVDDYDDDDGDDDDEKKSFRHVVEFEVTSADFVFSRIDTISVPFVLRTSQSKKVKVRMFVFNPTDPDHGPDGYSVVPDLVKTIKVDNTDRALALAVPKGDIAYLNTLPPNRPIFIKVKIRASLNTEFELASDTLFFIATTTDAQDQPVRHGIQEYVDPGLRDPDMAVISHKTGFLVRVNSLQPGVMNVNWAFEPHVHDPNANCSGVTRIVLGYNGTGPVDVEVFLKKKLLVTFSGVNTGDLLEVIATDDTDEELHPEIVLKVDGVEGAKIHTSCSKPIAIGDVHGDFVINDLDILPAHGEHGHNHHHDEKRDISIEVYKGLVVNDRHKDNEHGDDGDGDGEDKRVIRPGRITKDIGFKKEDNTLVARSHVHAAHGASNVGTGFFEVDTGIYTIVFFNDDNTHDGKSDKFTVVSKPFAAPGGDDSGAFKQSTGFYASVYKDYVILAESESVSLKAVVRQVPGPSENAFGPWAQNNIAWSKHLVLIQSWGEPIDVAPLVFDLDDDGILDEVDGQFTGGAFGDQSSLESNDFTDQHRGGITFGTITGRAGIDVRVRDLNNPADGVLIWATGQGNAVASVSLCGATLLLTIGDVVKATCGSLTLEVVDGSVEVALGAGLVVKVPKAAIVRVEEITGNTFSVENLPESGATIVVENQGIQVSVEAGATVTVSIGLTPTTPGATVTPTPSPIPGPTFTPEPTPTVTPMPTPDVTPIPVPTPTATPLPSKGEATEDWESGGLSGGAGWLGPWEFHGGSDVAVTSSNGPRTGSFHLRIRDDDGRARRSINLSGQSGVHLTFYAKIESFESGDEAMARVSPDGVNWTTVKTWTNSDSENVYELVDIDLDAFTMTANFFIAFEGDMSSSRDRLLIDDIAITKTPPEPTATATPLPSTGEATEDWESGGLSGGAGWLGPWEFHGGSDVAVTSSNGPRTGSFHLRIRDDDGRARRSINLSGQSGVHLTFYAKIESFESGDEAMARVSPDGVNWTTVKTWTNSDSENVYELVDIDLDAFTMTANFFIAFEGDMSSSRDRLLIDDIAITKTPPEPTPTP